MDREDGRTDGWSDQLINGNTPSYILHFYTITGITLIYTKYIESLHRDLKNAFTN